MSYKHFLSKAWRAINQDRIELHRFPAVQTKFHLPDLTPLTQTLVGESGLSGMAGHALLLYNLTWQMNAQLVVEIGLGPGDSTSVFLLAMQATGGKLVSIDIEAKPLAERKVDLLGLRDHWEFICKPSEIVAREWKLERKIDILLVDGLHTYNQVKLEYRLFKPLMKKGGYMLFHDSETIRGVRKFVQRLRFLHGGIQFPFSNGLYVIRL
jgi:hypothetical protein